MTKLVELRVRVAVDDPVPVDTVKGELSKRLRAAGIQTLEPAADGADASLVGPPSIFWPTADVVRTDRAGGRKGKVAADA